MHTDQPSKFKDFFESLAFKDISYHSFRFYECYLYETDRQYLVAHICTDSIDFTFGKYDVFVDKKQDGWFSLKLFGRVKIYKEHEIKHAKAISRVQLKNPTKEQVEILKKIYPI